MNAASIFRMTIKEMINFISFLFNLFIDILFEWITNEKLIDYKEVHIMTDHEDIIDVLQNFKRLSKKKRRKFFTCLMFDREFIKWLFQPEKTANLTQIVEDMYKEFTKPTVMEAIIECIEYEGYSEFNRSHATFLTTICNLAIDRNNEALKEYDKAKRNTDISRAKLRAWSDGIDASNELIVKLLKRTKRIVKREATCTAKDANLPKYITVAAYTSIPEPKYVDRFKIGYYMNNLLTTIYSDVEENGEFPETVKWKIFFEDIFGKQNVVECATFILLEGVHRIDKYRNSDDVMNCWDSLTEFALAELNRAPDALRDQMMELYIKRVDKMFSNKAFDLRTNLLEVPKYIWPQLYKTVKKYSENLIGILTKNEDTKEED